MKTISDVNRIVENFRRSGIVIIDRNAGCRKGKLFDIVAYEPKSADMVFVIVRGHRKSCFRRTRMSGFAKKDLDAYCNAKRLWSRRNRWRGRTRIDVVDVWRTDWFSSPDIDHIKGVWISHNRRIGGAE